MVCGEVHDRRANPPITHMHMHAHTHTLVSGTPEPTQDEASQAFGLWQEAS